MHCKRIFSFIFSEEVEVVQTCCSFPHFTEGGSEGGIGRGVRPLSHNSWVAGVGQWPEIPE